MAEWEPYSEPGSSGGMLPQPLESVHNIAGLTGDVTGAELSPFLVGSTREAFLNSTSRLPTANDDVVSGGYQPGNLWNANGTLMKAIRTTPSGQAIWQRVPQLPLPGDIVIGLLCAYGTRRLRAAYGTGPCFDVTRASDGTTIPINFLADGSADYATFDAFVSGTTFSIPRVYDHSGNGWHAVNATPASQPTSSASSLIGNSRTIQFNVAVNGGAPTAVFLQIPAGAAINGNSATFISLAKSVDISKDFTTVGFSNGTVQLSTGLSNTNGLESYYGGHNSLGVFPSQSSFIIGFTNGSAVGRRAFVNEVKVNSGTYNSTSNAYAGGYLGAKGDGTGSGYCEIAAALVWNVGITQAQQDAITASLHQTFGIQRQVRNNLMCVGDSITLGYLASNYQKYPRRLQHLLRVPANIYSYGVGGQTVQYFIGTTAYINAPFDSTCANNVMIFFAGTNNLGQSESGLLVWSRIQTYLQTYKPAGWKILIATTLPRSSFTTAQETERQNLNNFIRAGWQASSADGLIDFAADPTMGAVGAAADTTLYSDGTHPSDLGYSYLAAIAAPVINSFMV